MQGRVAQRACPRKLPNAPVCCFAELCLRPWNPREHRVRPRLRTVSHAVMSVEPVDVGAADAVQVRVTRHNEIVPGIQPPGGIRRVPTAVVVEETPELKVNTCLQVHAAALSFLIPTVPRRCTTNSAANGAFTAPKRAPWPGAHSARVVATLPPVCAG